MNAILPANPMIDVLTDAIASKRDTMAIMETALKQAREDLAHLRERRAALLARAAGFEVGQVWVVDTYNYRNKPGVIVAIAARYSDDRAADDWRIDIAFGAASTDKLSICGKDATTELIGRVESGPLAERLTALLRKPEPAVIAA